MGITLSRDHINEPAMHIVVVWFLVAKPLLHEYWSCALSSYVWFNIDMLPLGIFELGWPHPSWKIKKSAF